VCYGWYSSRTTIIYVPSCTVSESSFGLALLIQQQKLRAAKRATQAEHLQHQWRRCVTTEPVPTTAATEASLLLSLDISSAAVRYIRHTTVHRVRHPKITLRNHHVCPLQPSLEISSAAVKHSRHSVRIVTSRQ